MPSSLCDFIISDCAQTYIASSLRSLSSFRTSTCERSFINAVWRSRALSDLEARISGDPVRVNATGLASFISQRYRCGPATRPKVTLEEKVVGDLRPDCLSKVQRQHPVSSTTFHLTLRLRKTAARPSAKATMLAGSGTTKLTSRRSTPGVLDVNVTSLV